MGVQLGVSGRMEVERWALDEAATHHSPVSLVSPTLPRHVVTFSIISVSQVKETAEAVLSLMNRKSIVNLHNIFKMLVRS